MIVFRTGDDKDSLAGLVHEVAGSSPVGGAFPHRIYAAFFSFA